ncbi:MAG TPA: acyl-CoA dehydrogenase family protein [Rubrivivax sp.]|jgi:alkylation response protein AidB-like acyl-CoA dehydrogenase|nr:acyl-CoA dehydrogenase family protein [Rubrivivax sp.]
MTAPGDLLARTARFARGGGGAGRGAQGGRAPQLAAARARLYCTRMADRQLAALAQAMGGEGLRERHPFGRHLVHARAASFVDGSTEMLLERIAARQGRIVRAQRLRRLPPENPEA